MRVQTLLTAAVMNLTKLLKAVLGKPALAGRTALPSASSLHSDLLWLLSGYQLSSVLIYPSYRSNQSEST